MMTVTTIRRKRIPPTTPPAIPTSRAAIDQKKRDE